MAFIPLSDVNARRWHPPYVTGALIGLNVIVYFLLQPSLGGYTSAGDIPASIVDWYNRYAIVPAAVVAGQNTLSLLTAMFLHGGVLHLAGNMLYLWIFGDNIEDILGHWRFLGFYLGSGVAASAVQVALFPESTVWNLGASGAIAGVLGAYLVMFPKVQVNVIVGRGYMTRLSAIVVIGAWFALQLFAGGADLMSAGSGSGVAYWAHVGGFVAGAAFIFGAKLLGLVKPV